MKHLLAGVAAAMFLLSAERSHAFQFERAPIKDNAVALILRGPIVAGDFERLRSFVGTLPREDRIVGLFVDSPGGSVFEAERFARFIAAAKLTVAVADNSQCASACFLLFAASPRRFAGATALIGVHSASEDGQETLASMGVTTVMARDAAGYGVPPSVISRMIQATPGRMEWLTPSDFKQMGVTVFPAASPVVPAAAGPDAGGAPAAQTPEPPQAPVPFQQGQADRRNWEGWFASLSGAFREGAQYWTGERSKPRPGTCYGPTGQAIGDWTAGCAAAKARLKDADLRRRSEPDYRTGWNSP